MRFKTDETKLMLRIEMVIEQNLATLLESSLKCLLEGKE